MRIDATPVQLVPGEPSPPKTPVGEGSAPKTAAPSPSSLDLGAGPLASVITDALKHAGFDAASPSSEPGEAFLTAVSLARESVAGPGERGVSSDLLDVAFNAADASRKGDAAAFNAAVQNLAQVAELPDLDSAMAELVSSTLSLLDDAASGRTGVVDGAFREAVARLQTALGEQPSFGAKADAQAQAHATDETLVNVA